MLQLIYGADEDPSQEEIEAACKRTNAYKLIMEQPEKWRTSCGDLSPGQKQIITITRALLRNPQILVLDECTASLDADTQELVATAIGTLMEGRTTVQIAHRLVVIQNSDSISCLEDGVVAEQGTHRSLMQMEDGMYHRMVLKQNLNTDSASGGDGDERQPDSDNSSNRNHHDDDDDDDDDDDNSSDSGTPIPVAPIPVAAEVDTETVLVDVPPATTTGIEPSILIAPEFILAEVQSLERHFLADKIAEENSSRSSEVVASTASTAPIKVPDSTKSAILASLQRITTVTIRLKRELQAQTGQVPTTTVVSPADRASAPNSTNTLERALSRQISRARAGGAGSDVEMPDGARLLRAVSRQRSNESDGGGG